LNEKALDRTLWSARFRRGRKVTILNARIYLLKPISFSLCSRTFQTSFHSSTSTRRRGGLKWIRVDLYPPSSSVYWWTTC